MSLRRCVVLALVGCFLFLILWSVPSGAAPSGPPIRIGGTLAQGIGADPEKAFPNSVFDALASTGKPPKTVAIVTSKFPSLHFISVGARGGGEARNEHPALSRIRVHAIFGD